MTTYSGDFAEFYELTWAGYVAQATPQIRWLLGKFPVRLANRWILDLGCGSGDMANYLMGFGDCDVVGIDLSADMIDLARRRNERFVEAGRALFIEGDIRDFSLDQKFGVVTATYAVLNHFDQMASIQAVFQRAFEHLDEDGVLYFDLFTRAIRESIQEGWSLDEPLSRFHDFHYVQRGGWIEGRPGRVAISVNGFRAEQDGRYRRFHGSISMAIHELADLEQALADTGFQQVAYLDADNLTRVLEDPDQVDHVAVVAGKSPLSFGLSAALAGYGLPDGQGERLTLAPRTDVVFLNGLVRITTPGSDHFVETANPDVLDLLRQFLVPRCPDEVIGQMVGLPSEEVEAFVENLKHAGALVGAGDLVGRTLRAGGHTSG